MGDEMSGLPSDPEDTGLPFTPDPIVGICHEYARLGIMARKEERDGRDRYAMIYRQGAAFLYDLAPPAARPYLDEVKKVLEIDIATTDVNVILLRASVLTKGPRP